jgi:hypothetical protein
MPLMTHNTNFPLSTWQHSMFIQLRKVHAISTFLFTTETNGSSKCATYDIGIM